jgi:hypothetical protein
MEKPLWIKHFALPDHGYAQSYPQKMCETLVSDSLFLVVVFIMLKIYAWKLYCGKSMT